MNQEDLCYMPAYQALSLFKSRQLKPSELMHALLDRLEKVNPLINGVTAIYHDEAMQAAKLADDRYMQGDARSLEGLAVAIKDEMQVAGKIRTQASLLFADHIDQETNIVVQRLLDAGAICHAKTTTPEFCILGVTHSRLHGVTRNIWDSKRTSGGSSGGSASLLSAGATTLATGSDIGGSIRIPAACTGTSGYKPPYGRNPESQPWNLNCYSHVGPLARNVRDCALMQNVISGQSTADITSLRDKVIVNENVEMDNLQGVKIAWSKDLCDFDVDNDVIEVCLHALEQFQALGAEVVEVDLNWPRQYLQKGELFLVQTIVPALSDDVAGRESDLCEATRLFLELGAFSDGSDIIRANVCANQMHNRLSDVLSDFDVLLCPTLSQLPVAAERVPPVQTFYIDGVQKQIFDESWCMTVPFNMLSRCPVLAIPAGFTQEGIPVGLQMVGSAYHDERVFEIAIAFQNQFSPFATASSRPKL